jgi:hypothetical protein
MTELRPPVWTSLGWLFTVFGGSLLAFHLMLVWPRNLTKRGWKVVDYFWLGVGLLGVIGSAGVGRQVIAENLLSTARGRVDFFASQVESALRFGTSGAICRRFARTEFSPPQAEFDRLQREFDDQCAWFTQAIERLKASPLAKRERLSLDDLGGSPPVGADRWTSAYAHETVDRYNAALTELERLARDARRTELELTLIIVGPFLLVVALALRIARVTGELRHELV